MRTPSTPEIAIEVRDDIVELRPPAVFDRAFAERALAALAELQATRRRVFVLSASGQSVTPEARKLVGDWLRTAQAPLETAVWGGGAVHRAISEMIARSIHFFRPGRVHITFHRTRDDALAWISARRSQPPDDR